MHEPLSLPQVGDVLRHRRDGRVGRVKRAGEAGIDLIVASGLTREFVGLYPPTWTRDWKLLVAYDDRAAKMAS